ncbi:MAG: HipA domain-containing protein [Lachnospiraceae bacterium]|nr:HipA domain-containing protein [Lachnospiraceae bacterium]
MTVYLYKNVKHLNKFVKACGYNISPTIIPEEIGISCKEIEQFYRRMVFNCIAVNQDDHVKNISFING